MNWPTHARLGCHIGANWHLMVRKRFSHHIILYCKYILQALLALGFGSHMSFCLALKRQEFPAHTLAEVAGAAWLPGTQSGTAGGADVCPWGGSWGCDSNGKRWEWCGKHHSHRNKAGRGVRSWPALSWQLAPPDGMWVVSSGTTKMKQKARLQSSLNPWGFCGSPSLEPVWGSTHLKSPKPTSPCPRAALTLPSRCLLLKISEWRLRGGLQSFLSTFCCPDSSSLA